jgi:hypothetical protein
LNNTTGAFQFNHHHFVQPQNHFSINVPSHIVCRQALPRHQTHQTHQVSPLYPHHFIAHHTYSFFPATLHFFYNVSIRSILLHPRSSRPYGRENLLGGRGLLPNRSSVCPSVRLPTPKHRIQWCCYNCTRQSIGRYPDLRHSNGFFAERPSSIQHQHRSRSSDGTDIR